jgi:hypothetical protein
MLKILLISVPFLFVFGSLLHFIYEWSKENKLVGLFSPINESIFEHSKLLLFPLIMFWGIGYFFLKDIVDVDNYFFAMLVSIAVSIIVMICFYYTYKEIVGNSYLWVDIFDLLLSLFVGQVVANHVYVYSEGIPSIFSISIVITIAIFYIYLTFKPFKTPFFIDEKNKTYGINKKDNHRF